MVIPIKAVESHALSNYFKENGIIHHRVTPIWPQANGEVESFMRPLNKDLLKSKDKTGDMSSTNFYLHIGQHRILQRERPQQNCFIIVLFVAAYLLSMRTLHQFELKRETRKFRKGCDNKKKRLKSM